MARAYPPDPVGATLRGMTVLVTGATGYIGGRLAGRLVERGVPVRVLVRDPQRIRGRWWEREVEVVSGDLFDAASVARALEGVEQAYYLVHSMSRADDFADRDRIAARNFVHAGRALRHCIYLGGLVPTAPGVSEHLQSRGETGAILRGGLPTTEFRAGPIVGSGSASFEMVRYLAERLPFMVAPRWITNAVQPIAVRDVLAYLVQAREHEPAGIVEIGGADVLSFAQMIERYAEVRGLVRKVFAVPGISPGLAALWIDKITPIPKRLAMPLMEGIVHPVLADTRRAEALFPEITPMAYRRAVKRALVRVEEHFVESRWSDALGGEDSYELRDREGLKEETRTIYVAATPDQVFRAFCRIGGEQGWLVWNSLWRLRGFIDRMLGGPGLRRGRRDPQTLYPGEVVDFWRVEMLERPRLLRLRAEFKVPGQAWLQFTAVPEGPGTRLIQTAFFAPRGLLGLLYWYAMYPAHLFIFGDMARALAGLALTEPAVAPEPRASLIPETGEHAAVPPAAAP